MSRASTIIAEVSHVQRMVYVRTRGTCDVYQGYLLVPLKYNIVESWYMYRMTQRLRPMYLRPHAVPLEPSWLYMFLFIITSLNSLTFFQICITGLFLPCKHRASVRLTHVHHTRYVRDVRTHIILHMIRAEAVAMYPEVTIVRILKVCGIVCFYKLYKHRTDMWL